MGWWVEHVRGEKKKRSESEVFQDVRVGGISAVL